MLKALIVDDEPIIRSGIRRIIEWEKYGYEIYGEAEDGPSAVKAILELKPDLVLLDLHLPGFHGLEVVRKTRDAGARTHFLVLSGYEEFEYAKEAINLEVDGYITKPVDENILIERIASIAGKINEEKEKRQIQFLEIMEGVKKPGKGEHFLFGEGYVQAVFVSLGNVSYEEAAKSTQALRDFFQKDICHIFQYREFTVFLFENTLETVIKSLLDNLCAYLSKSETWPAVTLGSRCCEEISSHEEISSQGAGIKKTCLEAESLMDCVFFYRDKKYLCVDDMREIKNSQDWDMEEDARKLCALIQVVDNKKIHQFLRELEKKFFQSGKSPQDIRQECMALMIEVRSGIIKKFPALREMLDTGRTTYSSIMKERYLTDVIDVMINACLRISESLPLLSADSSFQRIISYVKNNYNEDLRLETLGQLFNYNCAYLGKRFKEYTGKNFHTYLDMLRIEAAKEFLQNTDMKVYEISEAVGYSNTDYFYSKFKKYAGKSPLVFRKKEEK
ncbi:MAG: response regulator [Treponema sp.]|jgi:two-component system response regulator YesN|nr:response regulator [Treponema sp.]